MSWWHLRRFDEEKHVVAIDFLMGFAKLASSMEHLPISFASDFNQIVLSLLARSVSIVSSHPVTGSKSFLAKVVSCWVVLSMCG